MAPDLDCGGWTPSLSTTFLPSMSKRLPSSLVRVNVYLPAASALKKPSNRMP